jgi:hypothetical protein
MADRQPPDERLPAGQSLAVTAQALFLVNLLLAPGIAFVALFWLRRRHPAAPPLARNHLEQTFWVSLWGGLLIVVLSAAFLLLGGLQWAWTWVVVILYFTCIHSTLVLCGMFGLARAMAGRTFRFPLIGPPLERQ